MAVAVVDLLEVVDVEHGEGQRLLVAARPHAGILEQLEDVGVVVQPGEAVAHHARLEVARACRAVAHGGDQVARLDRLGQEVVAALAHGVELLVYVVLGGQVDDRHADVALVVADHLGQLGAQALGHVHVEDDQVGLEVGEGGHHLDRVGEAAGDDPGAVEHALGEGGLRPRVVDDQHLVGLGLGEAGQVLETLEQGRGIQAAAEEVLAAGAHRGQAGAGVGLLLAEEQHRQLVLQALLGLFGQLQAAAVAGEVDFHDDGGGMALAQRLAEGVGAVQRQRGEAEELQLTGQALAALAIQQGQVDRLAQQAEDARVAAIALAQAAARQTLHQAVELADQRAVEAPAVGLDGLQTLLDGTGQLGVERLLEALGALAEALVGCQQFVPVDAAPGAALQALPELQHLAGLVEHPLGEMLLEAITAELCMLGHVAGSLACLRQRDVLAASCRPSLVSKRLSIAAVCCVCAPNGNGRFCASPADD
ncbi:hypothetical protein D3C78_451510 [compost metagenome]